jgi:hypothetical protein
MHKSSDLMRILEPDPASKAARCVLQGWRGRPEAPGCP